MFTDNPDLYPPNDDEDGSDGDDGDDIIDRKQYLNVVFSKIRQKVLFLVGRWFAGVAAA